MSATGTNNAEWFWVPEGALQRPAARSRTVDAAHQRCSRRGDRIHHQPEQERDISDYYAFFVFDPDGLHVEVFSPGPQGSSRIHTPSKIRLQQTSEEGQRDE